jgi:hypothetical protein
MVFVGRNPSTAAKISFLKTKEKKFFFTKNQKNDGKR